MGNSNLNGSHVVIFLFFALVGFIATSATAGGDPMKEMCNKTDHQDLCIDALKNNANATDDPVELIMAAFKAVIKHIDSTAEMRGEMGKEANDSLDKGALTDCDGLLQNAVEELEDSIEMIRSNKLTTLGDKVSELMNWLSAVISYQETCKDGFDKPEMKSAMNDGLLNATQLTSNALAIVAGISEILKAFDLPSDMSTLVDRFLVEDNSEGAKTGGGGGSFPSWLSPRDRKLLAFQDPTTMKPNAVVAQDGTGQFKTINEAVNAIPQEKNAYTGRYIIYVKAGIYKENVVLTKKMINVFMYGDGPTKTIVSGSKNYIDGTPTFQTATFAAEGVGFICRSMGFENTAGYIKHQAVAFRSQSDMSAYYDCHFNAYQDTLYAQTHRQFYSNCLISGTVDYIFGDSSAVFQNCKMVLRKPGPSQSNMVTAHGRTDKHETTGFVLQNCTFEAEPALFPDRFTTKCYLGRPWKLFARTMVMESEIPDFIQPEGWMEWDAKQGGGTDNVEYTEYANTGPGANTDKRVTWKGFKVLTDKNEALQYTAGPFLQGNTWLADTGAPFILGLKN